MHGETIKFGVQFVHQMEMRLLSERGICKVRKN